MGIRPRDPILTTWLPLWELRHKDLSPALPLSGSVNPSLALAHPPRCYHPGIPSWTCQGRGPWLTPGSQLAQKPCSPVVLDVVFYLVEAHGVAQGQVVGASLY